MKLLHLFDVWHNWSEYAVFHTDVTEILQKYEEETYGAFSRIVLLVDQLVPFITFDWRDSYVVNIERTLILLWHDTTSTTEVPVYRRHSFVR